MGALALLELFLVLSALYALLKFEGGVRAVVPIICLAVVFLFERVQRKLNENREVRKRILRYKLEDQRRETVGEKGGE